VKHCKNGAVRCPKWYDNLSVKWTTLPWLFFNGKIPESKAFCCLEFTHTLYVFNRHFIREKWQQENFDWGISSVASFSRRGLGEGRL